MLNETTAAYIAGLFDGEGSIQYKQKWEKKKNHKGDGYRKTYTWRISMEIGMPDAQPMGEVAFEANLAEVLDEDELANELKSIMSSGNLVSDEILNSIVASRLKQRPFRTR